MPFLKALPGTFRTVVGVPILKDNDCAAERYAVRVEPRTRPLKWRLRIWSVGKSVGRKAFALLWRAAQQKAKPKARRKSQEPFAIVKRLLPRLSKDERAELRAELDRLE